MIYRETGQFKPSYKSDTAVFPIAQDRWVVIFFVAILALVPLGKVASTRVCSPVPEGRHVVDGPARCWKQLGQVKMLSASL